MTTPPLGSPDATGKEGTTDRRAIDQHEILDFLHDDTIRRRKPPGETKSKRWIVVAITGAVLAVGSFTATQVIGEDEKKDSGPSAAQVADAVACAAFLDQPDPTDSEIPEQMAASAASLRSMINDTMTSETFEVMDSTADAYEVLASQLATSAPTAQINEARGSASTSRAATVALCETKTAILNIPADPADPVEPAP